MFYYNFLLMIFNWIIVLTEQIDPELKEDKLKQASAKPLEWR